MKNLLHWLALSLLFTLMSACSPWPDKTLKVGDVAFLPCEDTGYCATIERPLNPTDARSKTLLIGMRWFPHKAEGTPSKGVITIVDGGPGYGATTAPEDYLALFAGLLETHDLLMVDNRGTGSSGALACESLDGIAGLRADAVKTCGAKLGPDAYYYGSAYAADDLAAVLEALKIAQIDLYGISYGTFFSQVFASRHPGKLSKLILDSAYPAHEAAAFFSQATPTLMRALAQTCVRSGGCPNNRALLPALLNRLRQQDPSIKIEGNAPDSLGEIRKVALTPGSLYVALMNSAGGLIAYRDFDSAAAAYLENDDATPLLRLVAEGETLHDASASSADPKEFSKALFLAVSCSDYPRLYDVEQKPDGRRAQLKSALSRYLATNPGIYAPFTFEEFRTSNYQENSVDVCIDWPAPPAYWQRLTLGNGLKDLASLPTLVLSGEFDPLTTPAEAEIVAKQFPAAKYVMVANSVHAPAYSFPEGCLGDLITAFISAQPLVTACATQSQTMRPVGAFYRSLSSVRQIGKLNEVQSLELVATNAAYDALSRLEFGTDTSRGLRGGLVTYDTNDKGETTITLDQVKWVDDATVSGVVRYYPTNQSADLNLTTTAATGETAKLITPIKFVMPGPSAP